MNSGVNHAAAMFPAIEAGNMDALRKCFAPGAVVWHNDDRKDADIDAVCQGLSGLCDASEWVRYENQEIVQTGNLYYSKHDLTAQLKSGERMLVPALMRIETNEDGLVTRIDEYYDSRATDCLTGRS